MSEAALHGAAPELTEFWNTLMSWNERISLVSSNSVADGWARHVEDSAQLARHFPARAVRHCDLGSGGGLPAIPIAIRRREAGFADSTVLIEADARKAAFLRTACRNLEADVTVVAERIERTPPQGADVVTARALAPLERLLGHVARHLAPAGFALLPKGRSVEAEIEAARRLWSFDAARLPSATAEDATILKVSDIKALVK